MAEIANADIVSTRAPAKGATKVINFQQTAIFSFNSRSREGSDGLVSGAVVVGNMVSTRAPAKGATKGYLPVRYGIEVSTRAPAKGATFYTVFQMVIR